MNGAAIDIVFIALIVIFAIRCSLRGFIGEVMSMAAIVLGLGAAFFLYKNGAAYIAERFKIPGPVLSGILAFVIIFFVLFLVIKILGSILNGIVEGVNLGGADRLLGFLFGIIEGVVLVCLVLLVLSIQPLFDSGPLLKDSIFARYLLPYVSAVGGAVGGAVLNTEGGGGGV
jgi:membrane protein required for colicin V production